MVLSDAVQNLDLKHAWMPVSEWSSEPPPFPEANIVPENLGVPFAWGTPGPRRSKSRKYSLMGSASEECRWRLIYEGKEALNLCTRNHLKFQGFICQTKVGPPLKHKGGNAQGWQEIMRIIRRLQLEREEQEVGSLSKDIFVITRYFFHRKSKYLWIIISFRIPNMFPYSHLIWLLNYF